MAEMYDHLVLGSGVAGLSYALKIAEHGTVAIVTKKESVESNTNYAQGGIAAVVGPEDSFSKHIEDTLVAGAGLCHRDIVEIVVREGPDRVKDLIRWGAEFTSRNGRMDLAREGGHSANRIVHAADATGREIERALIESVRNHPNIRVFEYHFALELITQHHLGQKVTRNRPDITCFGAYVFDEQNETVRTFLAKTTMIATGGAGEAYLHTTNPPIATGDGIAMAYRAKARVANMEFIQFHPTALYHPEANSFLISEAVRGAGGLLLNPSGERFMPKYDARAELAPRDVVARAIDDQLKQRGDDYVLLDISHVERDIVLDHFPNIARKCLDFGIDITSEPIPVVPAAHYLCGGIMTDAYGRSSIRGLFVCGEAAHTGLHGANRLASNSLLEALVFSHRAVDAAVEYSQTASLHADVPDWDESGTVYPQEWVLISHNRDELQRVMWDYVGIVRSRLRLERAFRRTHLLYEETEEFYRRSRVSTGLCELRNLIAVGYLIIKSARQREESRGLHHTLDHPEPSEYACFDTVI